MSTTWTELTDPETFTRARQKLVPSAIVSLTNMESYEGTQPISLIGSPDDPLADANVLPGSGTKRGATLGGDNGGSWTNPEFAADGSNDLRANHTVADMDELLVRAFGFIRDDIPWGSFRTGYSVFVEGHGFNADPDNRHADVGLRTVGFTVNGDYKKDIVMNNLTDAILEENAGDGKLGGVNDLWGAGLSISDANFLGVDMGVLFRRSAPGTASHHRRVDFVELQPHWTARGLYQDTPGASDIRFSFATPTLPPEQVDTAVCKIRAVIRPLADGAQSYRIRVYDGVSLIADSGNVTITGAAEASFSEEFSFDPISLIDKTGAGIEVQVDFSSGAEPMGLEALDWEVETFEQAWRDVAGIAPSIA